MKTHYIEQVFFWSNTQERCLFCIKKKHYEQMNTIIMFMPV
jgi:hypothetical protein